MPAPEKARNSPKPDKLMRDALLIELQTDTDVEERGVKLKKLRLIARKMVEKAMEGDVQAYRDIADRTDGRPAQSLTIGGDADAPIVTRNEVLITMVSGDE